MLWTRRHSIVVPWDSLCYQCIPADCTGSLQQQLANLLKAGQLQDTVLTWTTIHPDFAHTVFLSRNRKYVSSYLGICPDFSEKWRPPRFYQHRLLIASPPLRVLISDPLRTLHNCTYYYFIDYCNISWSGGEIIVISQLEFLNGKIGLSAWNLRWAIFRLLRDARRAGSKSCVKEWHHRTVWLLHFVRCQKKKEQKHFQFWISFWKISKMFMFYSLFFFWNRCSNTFLKHFTSCMPKTKTTLDDKTTAAEPNRVV